MDRKVNIASTDVADIIFARVNMRRQNQKPV